MSQKLWEAIDPKVRGMVVAAFKMAEIDFERDFIVPDGVETEKANTSPWMTRAEAAEYAKCSTDTIDNWIAKGYIVRAKLDASRPGGVLIDRVSLEKFLRSKVVNQKKRVRETAPSVPGGYRAK